MKNTIRILLLLLLLLIGTCVYQKTYTLYSLIHSDNQDTTPKQNKTIQPILNTTLAQVEEKKATPNSHVPSNHQDTTHKQTKALQPILNTTLVHVEEKKEISKSTEQLDANVVPQEKETTILEKIKATVIATVTSDEEKPKSTETKILPSATQTTQHNTTVTQTTIDTQLKEKEVVEYLLKVLKERETTLTLRDETESKLQALIKAVLEERQVAIETMEKHSKKVEKEHKERLKMRDETATSIYQKYTEKKGN